ncbi:MAG: ATP-binding protein [Candidatus Methanomethylophilaceae archaeon]|nr:ATP-binding protein [Candidatus Methanomethylophilaceae archaeon]
MIERKIYGQILHSLTLRPVTLITGARQVGKTTLCLKLRDEKGMGYVTLRDKGERALARNDPDLFLQMHPAPLIVDEVQYAPALLESIESAVDRAKADGRDNKGMYVLTGSQAYKLMDNVTDSLAGRISLIHMSALSISEIFGREEVPFTLDMDRIMDRSTQVRMDANQLFDRIIRGTYPEPEVEKSMTTQEFYSDYVETYIDRDVSEIVNVRNKDKFHAFMQLVASLTGQELVYEHIASNIGIDSKTVKEWISVLIAGDIIHLLQPYNDTSTSKRVSKRPKLYFWDTGLACYLARVLDPESLKAGYLKGPMVETFMVNEVLKTYRNAKMDSPFYYYRNKNGEIDLVMIGRGEVSLIECKSATQFGWDDIKMIVKGIPTEYPITGRGVLCLCENVYPISEGVYALPVTSI